MINELIKISKYAGMREDLVQAGGGNSSVKLGKQEMLIKASGCLLGEMGESFGYSKVDYAIIAKFLEEHSANKLSEEDGKACLESAILEGKRPSIETFLHSITDNITLHTHPATVNVLTSRQGGMEILKNMFPDALLVDYATPGIKLAQTYYKRYKEQLCSKDGFQIIFLKNHGLIVSGKTAEEVMARTEYVVNKIAEYLNFDYSRYSNSTYLYNLLTGLGAIKKNSIVYLSTDSDIMSAAKLLEEVEAGTFDFGFCPDCLVYCGTNVLCVNEGINERQILNFMATNGCPVVLLYSGCIYIVAEGITKAKEIESVLRFSVQVMSLNKGHKMDYLTENEQRFILNWESEKYRRNMK